MTTLQSIQDSSQYTKYPRLNKETRFVYCEQNLFQWPPVNLCSFPKTEWQYWSLL